MPIVEMEEDIAVNIGGKFNPKADQTKYCSRFAVKDTAASGKSLVGFPNARDLQQRQPFGHGSTKGLSGWVPAEVPLQGTKNKGEHIVYFNGVPVVEMICDRESVETMDRWNGEVSRRRMDGEKERQLEKLERMKVERIDPFGPSLRADNMQSRNEPFPQEPTQ